MGTLLACGPSADKREARQVAAAIERVRVAKGASQASELAKLLALELRTSNAKKAQKACYAAHKALHEATGMIEQLESKRAKGLLDADALKQLTSAQSKLDDAQKQHQSCVEALKPLQPHLRS